MRLRHFRVEAHVSGLDAVRHAVWMRVCDVVVWSCRVITNSSIAALPESFGSLSRLRSLCVRRHLRPWL